MKNFENITDIFFDLDHTIYDFELNSSLTFKKIFQDLNLEVSNDFDFHFKIINDSYWEKFAKDEITKEELRYGRLKDTFNKINLNVSDDLILQIADLFIVFLPSFNNVFVGAHETLDYLQTKYRLHIITNGPDEVQVLKLKNSNLEKYFLTITNSEKAGVKKPNPIIFNHALALASTSADKSVMIGDNLEADVHGALNVGIKAIWFSEEEDIKQHSFTTINKLIELKNIF